MEFDEISLRHCAVEDVGVLATIGPATFLESFAGVLDGNSILMHCRKEHSAEKYREYFAQPETQAWLAVVQPGDAPVGYAMLTGPELPLNDISGDDIELKRIYLFSRFQRTGIGRLLFERSLLAAKEAGKARMLLGVHAENERALAFYSKNGFKQVGVRTFQVGATVYDDLVLGRPV